MSFEDRVLTLFAEANPVSDDATFDELVRPTLRLIQRGEQTMSDTKQRPITIERPIVKQERTRGLLSGVAAAIAALVLGTVAWISLTGSGENPSQEAAAGDEISIIEDFFQRWSEGDISGAIGLVGDPDRVSGNALLQREMEYVAALEPEGWFWSVANCAEQAPATYRCNVALIGDPLLDAMGLGAGSSQFKVEDGKLTEIPRLLGVGAAQADRRLAGYAETRDPEGYEAVCVGSNGRGWEENGVVYNRACGAFLAPFVAPLAAELNAP